MRVVHELLFLDFLPELDPNLIMWLNLVAVVVVLLALISAYRKEDLTERRFRILSQNYDTLLAEKLLKEMEEEDPKRAEEIRAKLREKLGMPKGEPKILMSPDKQNPEEISLSTLFFLDRASKTKNTGGQDS